MIIILQTDFSLTWESPLPIKLKGWLSIQVVQGLRFTANCWIIFMTLDWKDEWSRGLTNTVLIPKWSDSQM